MFSIPVHTCFSRQDTPGTDSSARQFPQTMLRNTLKLDAPVVLNMALFRRLRLHLCTDRRASRWDLSATASPRVRVDLHRRDGGVIDRV